MKNFFLRTLFIICTVIFALLEAKVEQVKEGNLALKMSQQPGPLFSFGQTIIDKHDLLLFVQPDCVKGNTLSYMSVYPQFVYGVRDDVAVFVALPIVAKYRQDNRSVSDVGDIFCQLEYAPYYKEEERKTKQITLIGAVSLPTGFADEVFSKGLGAPGFFVGATASYVSIDWYTFVDICGFFPAEEQGTRFGAQCFYQAGFGRNLHHVQGMILLGMLEFNGLYSARDKVCGCINPNSGGNSLSFAPSLFLTTERFNLQAGVSFVVDQRLFGSQPCVDYRVSVLLGWKFN